MKFFSTFFKRKTYKHIKRITRDGLVFTWLVKKILHMMRVSHFFIVKREYYKAYVHHDPFSLWMWMYSHITRPDEVFFHAYTRPGDTVIDVGANVGIITLTALHALRGKGKIISYEPHPHTATFLRKNISLNDTYRCVEVRQKALGASVGTAHILNHYVKDINHIVPSGGIEVLITTLDADVDVSRINILKIDAEGYELFVLQGAEDTLSRTDAVFVEYSPKTYTRFGYTWSDVYTILERAGFHLFSVEKNHALTPITQVFSTKQKYVNVLALRDVEDYYRRMQKD
jgi:FkbM family methyltransferase